jgi:erythromycin esterase-like protein
MTLTKPAAEFRARASSRIVSSLREAAEALPPPERAEDFGRIFDRFGESKLVLLGEASHGTSEFYRSRTAITRRLIEQHGFNIVAVEADWPDAASIDSYVRELQRKTARDAAFSRFPSWMWRNIEVREFVDWLHTVNGKRASHLRVEFRGLDIYSLGSSMAVVLGYLDRVDPAAANRARWRYGCLTPWQHEPARYGHRALMGGETCEDEVVAQLHELLAQRLKYIEKDGDAFFDAAQNARIVRAAEEYYRIMYRGSADSWNLRDRHMFNTLQLLMNRRGPDAKAIVWAHNSHIGNAAATSMGWQGEFNIGELCRTSYGNDMVAVGFGTDRGTVAAAPNWGEPMEIMNVIPARTGSYESLFRRTGVGRSLTDWHEERRYELRELLRTPHLERAIGVVYRPDTELLSHYFEALLPDQFDAYVWFETSRAITPLSSDVPEGVPETYPFGL